MSGIIKGVRILRGHTQEDVAKAIGMTVRTYCKKESNPDSFTVGELRRLSVFLGLDTENFFKSKLTVEVS